MDRETGKVFIIGVKQFSIYYLADCEEVVSRLELEAAEKSQVGELPSRELGESDGL